MKSDPTQIEHYEGLVRKTAAKYLERIQARTPDLEFDDVCQMLRIKAWRGIEGYNSAKATQTIEGYVFSCVFNQIKDLIKRQHRTDSFIEDLASTRPGEDDQHPNESFDAKYLVHEEDDAFAEILAETPLIPSTLSGIEVRVVICLYLDYSQAEVAETLSLSRREVARRVKSIKEKMADWRPSSPAAGSTGKGDHHTTSKETRSEVPHAA